MKQLKNKFFALMKLPGKKICNKVSLVLCYFVLFYFINLYIVIHEPVGAILTITL
jgi:hypothetical protein